MDTPLVSFELKEKFLLVVGHGRRDSLSSMVEAAAMIYEKIKETNSQYLLVDYRNLEIKVHMAQAFNIVKQYEATLSDLKKNTIAAVFGSKGLEFGNYWKEIARKRGFFIEIFDDIHVAEQWLLEQIS